MVKIPTNYGRLQKMMAKLKVSETHPAWTGTVEGMAYCIARRLDIHSQKTGDIVVDDALVDWLEEHMPKPKPKKNKLKELAQMVINEMTDPSPELAKLLIQYTK